MASEYKMSEESPYINSDWLSSGDEQDADFEFEQSDTLINLRRNSSSLIKNNPIAYGIQQNLINSTLSGTINTSVKSPRQSLVKNFLNQKAKDEKLDENMERMLSTAFERGDVLVNLPITRGNTKIELIEGSRIRTPQDKRRDTSIRLGVKFNKQNEEIGYYVRKLRTNQSSRLSYNDYTYVPAYSYVTIDGKRYIRRVAQLFHSPANRRPDQTRTQPLLTPLMPLLRSVSSFIESTIVGARLAASFSIIIRSKNPVGTKEQLEKTNGIKMTNIAKMKPGLIALLSGNTESIESPSPNRPFDNTDQFLRRLLRLMAMALQIPYEMLFVDLKEVNFSSWKGGTQSQKRNIFRWQRSIIQIREWIQMTWITEAYAKNELPVHPNRVVLATKMPKFEALDDEKLARADRLDVTQSKLKSKRTAVEDRNLDYDVEMAEIQKEAIEEINNTVEQLKLIKEAEEKHDIVFAENSQVEQEETGNTRDTYRREGEGEELTDEDKAERRKDDGNW